MSILDALAAAQADAEAIMLDTCTVARPTGSTTSSTGVVTPVTTTVYTGKCRIQAPPAVERDLEAAGRTTVATRAVLSVPVTATALAVGDVVTVTAATDPGMVGRALRVAARAQAKSFASARRYPLEEIS